MRRIAAPLLPLALACGLALAGCGGGRHDGGAGGAGTADKGADALIGQLNSFTDELLAKIDSAPDVKAGVAEARRLLDARAGELGARIAAHKRGAQSGRDAAARGRWLEAEVDNTERVHRLRVKYSDAAARDPELRAALAGLVADYDAMFGQR